MTYRVRLTDQAAVDFHRILDWIADRSPDGAIRWLDSFEQMKNRVQLHPFAHPLAPENAARDKQIRYASFGTRRGRKFRALYYLIDDFVMITHLRGPHQSLLSDDDMHET